MSAAQLLILVVNVSPPAAILRSSSQNANMDHLRERLETFNFSSHSIFENLMNLVESPNNWPHK
jgi:hypothetical protein